MNYGQHIYLLNKQSLSVMISISAVMIFGVIDIYFISLLGTQELTAAGIASPFIWIFNALSAGFALAISIFTAKFNKTNDLQTRVVYPLLFGCIIISLLSAIFYLCVIENSLSNFSNTPEIILYTQWYLSSWVYLYFPTLLFNSLTSVMRGLEFYKVQANVTIFSCLLNAVLDPILMFEPIGLGIRGAVYATALTQGVAILFFVAYILKKTNVILAIHNLNAVSILKSTAQLFKTASVTTPASIIWPISVLVSTYFISKLGDMEVAIMGVISKIQPLMMTPIFAISITSTVIISKVYQGLKWSSIKTHILSAIALMTIWQCLIAIPFFVFKEEISELMLGGNADWQATFNLYLTLIPITVLGRGLIYLLSQILPAMNMPKFAFAIDLLYAGVLHTMCYLVGYYFMNFSYSIYCLMTLNIVGIGIFIGVLKRCKFFSPIAARKQAI